MDAFHVAVTAMRALEVVVMKPRVQVHLQLFYRSVELLSESLAEELIEDGAVESLDKAVGPGRADLAEPVLDIVELQEELIGM